MLDTINPTFFKSIIQFNQESKEKIDDICSPLKEAFGITHFAYWRVFDEGRYFLISNSPNLIKTITSNDFMFRSKYFRNQTRFFCKQEPYKLIWPDNDEDEALNLLRTQNVANGFNIIRENKGSIEGYTFATTTGNSLIKTLYNSHFSSLDNFGTHFQKLAGDLIDPNDFSKQGVSSHLKEHYPQIENIFLATTPWERKIIEFNELLNSKVQNEIHETRMRHSLTPREFECLFYVSKGNSSKEIGQSLNISYRTVEAYIDKIRIKTSCHDKNSLTNWFENQFGNLIQLNS